MPTVVPAPSTLPAARASAACMSVSASDVVDPHCGFAVAVAVSAPVVCASADGRPAPRRQHLGDVGDGGIGGDRAQRRGRDIGGHRRVRGAHVHDPGPGGAQTGDRCTRDVVGADLYEHHAVRTAHQAADAGAREAQCRGGGAAGGAAAKVARRGDSFWPRPAAQPAAARCGGGVLERRACRRARGETDGYQRGDAIASMLTPAVRNRPRACSRILRSRPPDPWPWFLDSRVTTDESQPAATPHTCSHVYFVTADDDRRDVICGHLRRRGTGRHAAQPAQPAATMPPPGGMMVLSST